MKTDSATCDAVSVINNANQQNVGTSSRLKGKAPAPSFAPTWLQTAQRYSDAAALAA
jgi:hypothetical protein